MITERQIRGRFDKRHLRKLLEQMLEEDYFPYENGKRSATPIKWYTLRLGWTIDRVVEMVRYCGIEKKREDSLFVYMRGEYSEYSHRDHEEKWFKTDEFRLKEIPGTKPQAYEVLEYRSSNKSEIEKVDSWIKGHLLDHDRWVRNNTAIDIVIPGFSVRHK